MGSFQSDERRDESNGPRVWIDCTDTRVTDFHTGIQRVVRNLAHMARQVDRECMPVVQACGRWFVMDGEWTPPTSPVASISPHRDVWRRGASRLRDAGAYALQRVRKSVVPRRVASATVDLCRWMRWSARHRPVEFQAGDVLLFPDATWNHRLAPDYAKLRAMGVKTALCLNDILPVTHEQFFRPRAAARFRDWLDAAAPQVDFFMAISRTVRDELRDYVLHRFPEAGFRADCFEWYPLGVALDQTRSDGRVRPEIQAAFQEGDAGESSHVRSDRGPYLIVSTLEPRKNHQLLLDAFEQVWRRHPDARLCIVGRAGWMVDPLLDRIRRHSRFGRQLFWFDDLSDTELHYAYAHSRAFVFPSFAEGYGLPVVEALQHGLPVIASDTKIHREVAGEFASYFDPTDASRLAALVEMHHEGRMASKVRDAAEFHPTQWAESARVLLKKCRQVARLLDARAARSQAESPARVFSHATR